MPPDNIVSQRLHGPSLPVSTGHQGMHRLLCLALAEWPENRHSSLPKWRDRRVSTFSVGLSLRLAQGYRQSSMNRSQAGCGGYPCRPGAGYLSCLFRSSPIFLACAWANHGKHRVPQDDMMDSVHATSTLRTHEKQCILPGNKETIRRAVIVSPWNEDTDGICNRDFGHFAASSLPTQCTLPGHTRASAMIGTDTIVLPARNGKWHHRSSIISMTFQGFKRISKGTSLCALKYAEISLCTNSSVSEALGCAGVET